MAKNEQQGKKMKSYFKPRLMKHKIKMKKGKLARKTNKFLLNSQCRNKNPRELLSPEWLYVWQVTKGNFFKRNLRKTWNRLKFSDSLF